MDLLIHRSNDEELLDDLNRSGDEIDQNLKELEVINKWLGGDYVTIKGIQKIIELKKLQNKTITIADLGCGGGDMLIKISKWAKRKRYKVKLIGIDANPYIVDYARKHSSNYPDIDYTALNIFSPEFKELDFDIITSTLFTHHFDDEQLVLLFKQFHKQARYGILINDIHRHFLAFYSINLLTSLFSKSDMVKNDAGLSVKRAFKLEELKRILDNAGIAKYRIRWMWAFRWQILVQL